MDVDSWMRGFALTALTGLADTYNNGLGHNIELYVRPRDGRVMLLPWDQDHAFYYSPTSSLFGTGSHRLAAIIQLAPNRRLFCAHLLELCQTGFTNDFLDPVITHLSTVADRPAYVPNLKSWVSQRRTYVLTQLNTLHPRVPFEITSNGGADFTVATPSTLLEGRGWLDVRTIFIARPGQPPEPVEVTWLDGQRWRIAVPLLRGPNVLTLTASSALGAAAGSDSIVITNSGAIEPAGAANLLISEIHYHPASDGEGEEFIELINAGSSVIDLTGVRFPAGIQFDFTGSPMALLPPGERVLVVKDKMTFESRYGTGLPVAGVWSPFTELGNNGDRLTLVDRAGVTIADFSYDDSRPWPGEADGTGPSLTLIQPAIDAQTGNPARWRPSRLEGGSPGTSDALAAAGYSSLVEYATVEAPAIQQSADGLEVVWVERLGADQAVVVPEVSDSLTEWETDPGDGSIIEYLKTSSADGLRSITVRLAPPHSFFRLRVQPR